MPEPSLQNIAAHLKRLVRERNLYTSPEQLAEAGEYVRGQLQASGLTVRDEKVPFDGMHSLNILGMKTGSDPASGTFVLAAHYDTVVGTPGADDNASAVAALLETAHCLRDAPLKKSLLFAAFTLEEYGFVGSRHFVEGSLGVKASIHGMISLEMLGYYNSEPGSQSYPPYVDAKKYPSAGNFIAVVGNEPSSALTHTIADIMDKAVPPLAVERLVVPGRGNQFHEVTLSDHSPFWEYDIPAVMITDTAFLRNPNYHKASDTLETLNTEFIGHTTQGVCGFLENYLG